MELDCNYNVMKRKCGMNFNYETNAWSEVIEGMEATEV